MTVTNKSNQKFEAMTAAIIEQLEKGCVPWRKTWNRIVLGRPKNHFSGHVYTGINAFLLDGCDVPRFCTFKQAADAGHRIRKGAKSRPVYFWKMLFFDAVGNRVETRREAVKVVPFVVEYRVFNILDVEGFNRDMFRRDEKPTPLRIDECEAILERNPHEIRPGEPAYSPLLDTLFMPDISEFRTVPEFYATYFHELSHWTGHASRLNRIEPTRFGSEKYSKEELVAEMSACFLCTETGIVMDDLFQNTAAYLKSWIAVLKGDARLLMTAASAAEKASRFLIEGAATIEEEEEAEQFAEAA